MDEILNMLTERQREVYIRKQQGMSGPAIARELGITPNAVYLHIHHYERRIREYERYMANRARNEEAIDLPLNRGEVKVIRAALAAYMQGLRNSIVQNVKADWMGKLPYEYRIAEQLAEKAKKALSSKN